MRIQWSIVLPLVALLALPALGEDNAPQPQQLSGAVVDAATGAPLPARVYLRHLDTGTFLHVESTAPGGALHFDCERGGFRETHTSLVAAPFRAMLAPGRYVLEAERGHLYHTAHEAFVVADKPVALEVRLRRWLDATSRGWYSGETHVHRPVADLANAMLAEDLNVALPLSYWVTVGEQPPSLDPKAIAAPPKAEVVEIAPGHVYYPMNTEYEIFGWPGRSHTLGAVFVLNHKTPFTVGAPPLGPIREQARREGALFELDKHGWPWSMALAPILGVDLYELANNHLWRTGFLFADFGEKPADYMKVETDARGFTEWGWIQYGFENYYALLNCGFRMKPTAGSASGVHPVPLGFGRVYVHVPEDFSYAAWMDGLARGTSVVSTGPMLFATLGQLGPGSTHKVDPGTALPLKLEAYAPSPIARVEVVQNGQVVDTIAGPGEVNADGAYALSAEANIAVRGSGWVALRCITHTSEGRVRFAHTAPHWIEAPEHPLLPRREEIDFLIARVRTEYERSKDILPPAALEEYRRALETYEAIGASVR